MPCILLHRAALLSMGQTQWVLTIFLDSIRLGPPVSPNNHFSICVESICIPHGNDNYKAKCDLSLKFLFSIEHHMITNYTKDDMIYATSSHKSWETGSR